MKIITGKVAKVGMSKTVTVLVERVVVHPVYKKRFRKLQKYLVHDEIGVSLNDKVKFVASRPYSKLKKWKILSVIKPL